MSCAGPARRARRFRCRGLSLQVPPGQSLALLSRPHGTATALLDVIAGLKRPRAGELRVDGVALHRLGGREASRYRAGRGLVSPRFPLLASLPVTDNVLAAPSAGRPAGRMPSGRGAARVRRRHPADRSRGAADGRRTVAGHDRPGARAVPSPAAGRGSRDRVDSRAADRVLDVLMDAHARFGFTLVLVAERLAAAVRCERRVSLVDGAVAEDEITGDDDGWTRSRVDRIG